MLMFMFLRPPLWLCHHLRVPAVPAAVSKTGNVPRGHQHVPLAKHDIRQPGVCGTAGASETRLY